MNCSYSTRRQPVTKKPAPSDTPSQNIPHTGGNRTGGKKETILALPENSLLGPAGDAGWELHHIVSYQRPDLQKCTCWLLPFLEICSACKYDAQVDSLLREQFGITTQP